LRPGRLVTPLLRYSLLLACLVHVVALAVVVAMRLPFPFELEQLEGSIVDQVLRVTRGQPLYVEPGLDHVPYLYTPLYFLASAAASAMLGDGFLAPRLVSVLSTLGSLAIAGWLAQRETGSRFAALLAIGSCASTYAATGAWFDLARVDMLACFLTLLGVAVARVGRSVTPQVLAGVVLFLAFFTKQTSLFVAVAIGAWAAWSLAGAARAALLATFASLVFATSIGLDAVTGGWYGFYVFALGASHAWHFPTLVRFVTHDLLWAMAVPLALGLGLLARRSAPVERDRLAFFLSWLTGALFASGAGRGHVGGYLNALIPAYFALGVAAAVGLAQWGAGGTRRANAAAALLLLHLAANTHDLRSVVPGRSDLAAGHRLLEVVRSFPGEVYVADRGFVPTLAGKRSYAQGLTVWDVLRSRDSPSRSLLLAELQAAFAARRFDAVVVSDEGWHPEVGLERHYRLAGRVFSAEAGYPRSGARKRPDYVYVPR
jgi:hypothetical protein